MNQEPVIKTLNFEVLLKIILLFGFSAFFFMIVIRDRLFFYVHPRNTPYVILAGIAMSSVAIFLWKELFKPKKDQKPGFLFFFMIPLLLAFIVPARPFDINSGGYTNLNLMSRVNADRFQPFTLKDREWIEAFNPEPLTDAEFSAMNRPYLALEDGVITMNDNNFARWLMEIHENLDNYLGTPITLTGFVFRDQSMNSEEFVTSRMMMVCCVADLEMVGFLGQSTDDTTFPLDTWVRATGTLTKAPYQGVTIPMIQVEVVEEVVRPRNEYVYPF
jgi:putative membrane protein